MLIDQKFVNGYVPMTMSVCGSIGRILTIQKVVGSWIKKEPYKLLILDVILELRGQRIVLVSTMFINERRCLA